VQPSLDCKYPGLQIDEKKRFQKKGVEKWLNGAMGVIVTGM
jgi:hypothetical protein